MTTSRSYVLLGVLVFLFWVLLGAVWFLGLTHHVFHHLYFDI